MLKILIDGLKTSSMTFVQLAAIAIASILWARAIAPAAMGEFVFALTVATTAAFLCNPSLYAAANYFLSSKKVTVNELWSTQLLLTLLTGGIAMTGAGAIFILIRGDVTPDLEATVGFIALLTIGISAYHNFSGVMYGSQRVNRVTLWSVACSLLYLALTLLMLPTAKSALQPLSAYGLTQGIQGLGLIALAYPSKLSAHWNGALARELVEYGIAVYFGRVSTFLNQRLDAFLIMILLGEHSLGLYSVATTLGEMLWQLPLAINLILLANIAAETPLIATKRTEYTSRLIFTLTLLAAIGIAFIGGGLIPLLYGTAYAPAYPALLYLLPGIVLISTANIIESYFRAIKRPLIPSIAAVIALVFNVICNIILIPRLGIIGAATASTLAYTAQALLLAYLWGKQTNRPWWRGFLPVFKWYQHE